MTSTRWTAEQILEASIKAAEDTVRYVDRLEGDETLSLMCGSRGAAMALFAGEWGYEFTEVRAVRRYLRVDYGAIEDLARQIAGDEEYDDDRAEPPIAFTWEGEGFTWEECRQTDDRAVGFWTCSIRGATS